MRAPAVAGRSLPPAFPLLPWRWSGRVAAAKRACPAVEGRTGLATVRTIAAFLSPSAFFPRSSGRINVQENSTGASSRAPVRGIAFFLPPLLTLLTLLRRLLPLLLEEGGVLVVTLLTLPLLVQDNRSCCSSCCCCCWNVCSC